MHQRGSTLIEVTVAASIVALMTLAAIAMSSSSQPAALRTATTQFDAAMTYAQALAEASGAGATITLSGGTMTVYSGRPTGVGALRPSGMAPLSLPGVAIRETSAGSEPLSVFLDSAGHVSVAPYSGATPAPLAAEPACPAPGRWTFVLSDSRAQAQRSFACNVAVSN